MPEPEIRVSTTEIIPGEQRTIARFELSWIENANSAEDAYDGLVTWSRRNRYEAIIGYRIIAVPHVKTVPSGFGYAITTAIEFISYGTCVAY
jgi:hypothetical protein